MQSRAARSSTLRSADPTVRSSTRTSHSRPPTRQGRRRPMPANEDDRRYVETLAVDFLDRCSTAAEVARDADRLAGGTSRASIVDGYAQSPEWISALITHFLRLHARQRSGRGWSAALDRPDRQRYDPRGRGIPFLRQPGVLQPVRRHQPGVGHRSLPGDLAPRPRSRWSRALGGQGRRRRLARGDRRRLLRVPRVPTHPCHPSLRIAARPGPGPRRDCPTGPTGSRTGATSSWP